MSTTATTEIACPSCGKGQAVLAVESANVRRFPEFRRRLLDGTFMRFDCTGCTERFIVERDLLWTDLDAGLLIAVFPQTERERALELSHIVEDVYDRAFVREPPAVVRASVPELRCRVVFGYEELREKIVCFDGGLDDRILEALKLAIMEAQPNIYRPSLQAVDEQALWFAGVGSNAQPFAVDRRAYEAMRADEPALRILLPGLFAGAHVSVK
ncbi:MAG TPA: CpXC domain-containing protein [Casimicrobiaceae bacterium]|nr:CpXC domain-containing protein [Casimicrobiaceae bacterium]